MAKKQIPTVSRPRTLGAPDRDFGAKFLFTAPPPEPVIAHPAEAEPEVDAQPPVTEEGVKVKKPRAKKPKVEAPPVVIPPGRFVTGDADARRLVALIKEKDILTIDMETTGLSPWVRPSKRPTIGVVKDLLVDRSKTFLSKVRDEMLDFAHPRVLSVGFTVAPEDTDPFRGLDGEQVVFEGLERRDFVDVKGDETELAPLKQETFGVIAVDLATLSDEVSKELFEAVLTRKKLIGQNVEFDLRFLQHGLGQPIMPTTIHDTMLMAKQLHGSRIMDVETDEDGRLRMRPSESGFALDNLYARHVPENWQNAISTAYGIPAGDKSLQKPGNWAFCITTLSSTHYQYATMDIFMTRALYRHLGCEMNADAAPRHFGGYGHQRLGQHAKIVEMESEATKGVLTMTFNGVPFDRKFLHMTYEKCLAEFKQAVEDLCSCDGFAEFHDHLAKGGGLSGGALKKVVWEKLPEDRRRLDFRKQPSVSVPDIRLAGCDTTVWGAAWIKVSEMRKLLDYMRQYILALTPDDRIHAVMKCWPTNTGRMAAESPNLQNIPKAMKNDIISPSSGKVLVLSDFSQIELRLAAVIAARVVHRAPEGRLSDRGYRPRSCATGDLHALQLIQYPLGTLPEDGCADEREAITNMGGGMAKFIMDGVDLHSVTAADRIEMPLDEFQAILAMDGKEGRELHPEFKRIKKARNDAKGINFGAIYGQQAAGLRDYLKVRFGQDLTIEEAEEAIVAFYTLYPDVKGWHDITRSAIYAARANYDSVIDLCTIMGRQVRPQGFNQATNFIVQGSGADMAKMAMNRLRSSTMLVNAVHDELCVECDDAPEAIDHAYNAIRTEMLQAAADVLGAVIRPDSETEVRKCNNLDYEIPANFKFLGDEEEDAGQEPGD